jgi:hypothetical protein
MPCTCMKRCIRQYTELNVESTGLMVLRNCLDYGWMQHASTIAASATFTTDMASYPRRLKPASCKDAWKPLHMLE